MRYNNTVKKIVSASIIILVYLMSGSNSLLAQVGKNELVKDQHAQIGSEKEESKEHTMPPRYLI